MRITSQVKVEQSIPQQTATNIPTESAQSAPIAQAANLEGTVTIQDAVMSDYEMTREKVIAAVDSLNEFMQGSNYSSKFVFHDGLGKYFVQLVNPTNDEVIKEIPPKKLLDAFYEMQKMLGMIVDEKI